MRLRSCLRGFKTKYLFIFCYKNVAKNKKYDIIVGEGVLYVQVNVDTILNQLKHSVSKGNFEFVARANRSKSPVTSIIAKIVVKNLVEDDFQKRELDHDGSGEYIWVFISDDGIRYYIKFKFLQNDRVKFISFHETEY